MTLRKSLARILPWLLVPVLLFWALQKASLSEILSIVAGLSLAQWTGLFLLNASLILLFSSRWWVIARAMAGPLPYLALCAYRLAAFGVSYFTPGPHFGGEPLQVWMLHRRHRVPSATALAAVGLDKTFELLANFTFLLIASMIVLHAGILIESLRIAMLVVAVLCFLLPAVYLASLWQGRNPIAHLIRSIEKQFRGLPQFERISAILLSAEKEMVSFLRQRPVLLLQILGLSVLFWIGLIFEYWLAVRFLGQRLSLLQIIAAIGAARIAILLPIPAGLGTLEASQVLIFQTLGISPAVGLSLSLLIRARDLSFGLIGLALAGRYGTARSDSGRHTMREGNMPQIRLQRQVAARIPTSEGLYHLHLYTNNLDEKEHLALVMGEVCDRADVFVRVHSECLTGDVFGSLRCDCGEQLRHALELIAAKGEGILLYLRQEGRGIGLLEKLRAYNLQDQGFDTVDANLLLGHQADERDYTVAAHILEDLAVRSIRLLTNNPEKIEALTDLGVRVTSRVALDVGGHPENARYLLTKAERMNHLFNLAPLKILSGRERENGAPRSSQTADRSGRMAP